MSESIDALLSDVASTTAPDEVANTAQINFAVSTSYGNGGDEDAVKVTVVLRMQTHDHESDLY